MTWHYLSVNRVLNQVTFMIKYEDLLTDPFAKLTLVSKRFDLEINSEFQDVKNKMKNLGNKKVDLNKDVMGSFFDKEFILNEGYLKFFKKSDLDYINDHLEPYVLNKLNYELVL